MAELILKDEVYAIVGAAMEVHRIKGHGFAEPVYQECMEIKLGERGLPNTPKKEMPIFYKGRKLKKTYIADFVAYERIIVELKALDRLTEREEAQVINYLKSSGLEVAVLINFGAPSLEWKRIVLTNRGPESVDLQSKTPSRIDSRKFA
jgi:GxxExxY protein